MPLLSRRKTSNYDINGDINIKLTIYPGKEAFLGCSSFSSILGKNRLYTYFIEVVESS